MHYLLFVTFFPQLIAGPIIRHHEMFPQFKDKLFGKIRGNNIALGISILSIGLFKKVVLADSLALIADPVFSDITSGSVSSAQAWLGLLAFSFQIYFDFSGYTDMAIGSAMLFGIRLPQNFNAPYKSLNVREFWHKWHITLSRFLRDYLYIPLGGNRKRKFRTLIHHAPRRALARQCLGIYFMGRSARTISCY